MVSRLASLGYKLGLAGAILGVLAGCIQSVLGDDIPEWTGNKLHPVQLGIITIALSLVSLICVNYLEGHRQGPTRRRALAGLLILATAGICFTTVGRLWYGDSRHQRKACISSNRSGRRRPRGSRFARQGAR